MGNINFDKELRLKQGEAQYRLNKSKAGMSGSSAGQPRPYAKQNMLKARLFSPMLVGQKLTVTPKHKYLKFGPGVYYTWSIIEEGVGEIEGITIEAQEIADHFVVKPKGMINETGQKRPH